MLKKTLLLLTVFFILISTMVYAGITLRYYNKDSRSHTFPVKICGSSKTVTFEGSRTASVTIQGCSSGAQIKSSCGTVSVKNGDKIEIKNGCITVK